jgi:hypothetical protein
MSNPVLISDWKHDYETTAGTRRSVTNRRPAALPPVSTNERLSFAVDQFTEPASQIAPSGW